MAESVLKIEDLWVDYLTSRGTVKALRAIDLEIPQGQVVGVVGESGCGKSTLTSTIMRLMAENAVIKSGTIVFKGRGILAMNHAELRDMRGRQISMVFQDPMTALNPVLSIGTQMIDIQYREKVNRGEKRKRAVEMLDRVGIPDPESRLTKYPHHFSGGMRQRITIAMALLARPDLLIADEPTTGLDATLEVQIIHLLKDLQEGLDCAILLISHHLNVIAEICDRVVVMYAGEIVELGSVRDIFHRPKHPYTKALLECDPAVIQEKTRHLPTIPGEIPDLVNLPSGCIFETRCPHAMEVCRTSLPPTYDVAPGHTARCYLLEKGR
jgi:oligopeptide/dipeptide ABC transporter ATP-binding protein